MIPTYYLPYVGSNSSTLNTMGVAAGAGMNPAFWTYFGALAVLVVSIGNHFRRYSSKYDKGH